MKKFTFLAFTLSLFFITGVTHSQNALTPVKGSQTAVPHQRCQTMEHYDELFRTIPGFKQQFEANQARIEQLSRQQSGQRTMAINDTIPVVIHVIGSAAQQALITDAVLNSQIDVLNEDYQGRNADSTRIPAAFKPLFGKMGLTFKLALTSPTGTVTSGIERRTNAISFTRTNADNSKRFSTGGLDAWDPTKYLNLWVVEFSDQILGISVFPGDPRPTTLHGFVCDYRGFGRGASYLFAAYNRGRTTSHELGHFWNLRHIWADDGGACTGSDFPTTAFPSGTDDTPNQASEIYGNSDLPGTGTVVTDACSPTAPGIMYQNYMDYGDDIALVMFTKGQAARMEGALTVSIDRSPLLNSLTYLAPVAGPNDAGISAIIAPTTTVSNCITTSIPQVTLLNFGNNALTSVTITATVNGTVQAGYPYSWTGTLASGSSTNLTLPVINLTVGNNTVVFTTSQPNGVADGNPTNDSKTVIVNRASLLNLPVTEGFESATFPPAPWTVVSVNATGTRDWVRNTPGNASTGALYINNYNNSDGAIDDFRSGDYAANPTDSIRVTFDVAYRPYSATSPDSLLVLVSGDCGITFSEVYKKWGTITAGPNTLSTVLPANTASYVPASSADWRKETIVIPASLLINGRLQFVFRSKSRFGNNIWIDNINIEKVVTRDLKLVSLLSPSGFVCSNTITPQVVVTNNGAETITSYQVNYTINGVAVSPATVVTAPLVAGASATITLTTSNVAVGNQAIVVTVSNVVFSSGLAEQEPGNNSLTGNFTVVPLQNFVQEGFEGTAPGWTVANPNNNNTWGIIGIGNNSARSAFINNYDNPATGQIDDLRSPFVNTSNYDSLFVSFDVAHRQYQDAGGTINDSLIVFAVTGCGNNFVRTGYQKASNTLRTGASTDLSFLAPTASEWRRESIAIGRSVLGTGSNVLIAFRNFNNFGNNIFIDNVNITPLFKRDLQVLSINSPGAVSCSGNVTPSVTVKNNGSEVITGYKVAYTVDNGAPQTTTVVTGVSIPRNGTATINLSALATAASLGAHTIKVYSFEPVTASGTGDQYTLNDTLSKTFNVLSIVPAPLVESFTGTVFPPANWAVINPDGGITWRRYANGNGNAGSAYVNTFNYPANGQRDDLVTPFISYGSVDSVRLAFDVAAVTYSYPGSTEIPIDTLEVLVTRDCGNTFTSVYKKWGIDLQTINSPNDPQPTEFFPISSNQWRTEAIDLTQYAANSPVSVMFRVTNNFENNIFIDNVNFTTRTLPALLKQQGYLVLPTAFNTNFTIWHYQPPTTVKYINVVNSVGQIVWSRQYNGNADRQISVDLTGKSAGVYIVNIGYLDGNRNVAQKVVKY